MITTVVLPVAGLGTRFLPATKSVPKELLPVVDKPLVQYAIEEAFRAGIRHVVLVSSPVKTALERHLQPADPALVAELAASLTSLPGKSYGPLTVATADSFAYTDPVDASVSANQGIRVLFEGGSRIVFRLSGTGTEGATLRVYLERYEPVGGDLDRETPEMLAELIAAAEAIAGIVRHTGRTKPDVVT